ncbi:MAG TPA: putative toxin-antitoxin system toxin component, PIN family [Rhodothermales bacterium]|nr:putative toxin-antitoxin system toxin component, PIN family [Rhodothermales bacterium]
MSSKPRFAFDSNTIISAFLFEQSKPGHALQTALDRGELLLSMDVVTELHEVLGREKFDRYLSRKRRKELLSALIQEGVIVEITEEIEACRDPKNDKFLELAVSGEAACIVSGD